MKDVTYDNIKSHEKAGFQPFFRRYIFEKKYKGWEEGDQIESPRPRCRFRVKNHCVYLHDFLNQQWYHYISH